MTESEEREAAECVDEMLSHVRAVQITVDNVAREGARRVEMNGLFELLTRQSATLMINWARHRLLEADDVLAKKLATFEAATKL